jgi:DNA-binding IscR family transcriptional regulator
MLKENKIRNKGIDILARQENQTPVAIADIAKSENISVKVFRKYPYCWYSGFWVLKKEKGGYYLIKDPKEINMAHVYRILKVR